MKRLLRVLRPSKGVALVEYGLLVGLIVVATIMMMGTLLSQFAEQERARVDFSQEGGNVDRASTLQATALSPTHEIVNGGSVE